MSMKKSIINDKLFVKYLLELVVFFILLIPYILYGLPVIKRIFIDWKLMVVSLLIGMLLMIFSKIIVHYLFKILEVVRHKIK
jgi:hypothetical protein